MLREAKTALIKDRFDLSNVKRDFQLFTNTSTCGLGDMLAQEGGAIVFSSQTLDVIKRMHGSCMDVEKFQASYRP